jgi:hypothetical protein
MGTTAQDDLQYLRQIAEQGEKHPIQGGEFGILWGSLYMLASLYAYATLSGFLPFSNSTVLIAFLMPIPIGLAGHYALIKRSAFQPGAFSFGNRTSSAAWFTVGLLVQFSAQFWRVRHLILSPLKNTLFGGSCKPSFFLCTAWPMEQLPRYPETNCSTSILRWDWRWP